ncbi:MAG: hypothetical protein ACOYBQ_09935 [Fluviibacter sp.]
MIKQPQTIAIDLIDKINDQFAHIQVYQDKSSFSIKQLNTEAQKLIHADAKAGWCAKGMVASLCGDMESARYAFNNAAQLGIPDIAKDHWMISAVNLGYFTEGVTLYEEIGAPDKGRFTELANKGILYGAFDTLKRFLDEAKVMELDLSGLGVDTFNKVISILEKDGTTQQDALRLLDAAGEVLRSRKAFFIGSGPHFFIDSSEYGDSGCAHFQYEVPFSPNEASEMNFELAEKIAAMPERIPNAFCVSFISSNANHS